MADRLNTTRIGRAARLGGLAAGAAARTAGTRAANLVRNDERAAEATKASPTRWSPSWGRCAARP
jgi:hypothetical protein